MKIKPLQWSQSNVFGALKRRGFGIGGEFTAFNVMGLTPEQVAEKEAKAQAEYEDWVRTHVLTFFEPEG